MLPVVSWEERRDEKIMGDRMSRHASILLRFASSVAIIGAAVPALAQDADMPATGDTPLFGDIVVTAQKREQNVQDVPVSITAFSGDQINQLGFTNVTEVTQQIPGMQLNAWSPNVTIFNLRGISQNNFTDNLEAPVAVYLDNAYMGSINGISGQLFDIERVEVLRGPQGTLFGRNATGGLVHYLSRAADDDRFNGYVEAQYGRFEKRSIEGAIGGAIAEGVRGRLAARGVKGGSYIRSKDVDPANGLVGSGQDIGGENALALRVTTQLDLTPDVMVELWYKYSRDDDVPTGGYVFDNCDFEANGYCHVDEAGLTDGSGGVINGITGEAASPFEHFSNTPGHLDREMHVQQGSINWYLGSGIELTSITNRTTLDKDYREDGDALPVDVIIFGTTVDYEQFSQELRLSGESDSFQWQIGGYHLDMKIDGTLSTVGAPVIGAAIDINGAANSPEVFERYLLKSKNWSLFGQGELHLAETVSVIAGLRYSKDDKSIDYVSTLIDTGFPDVALATDEQFAAARPGVNRIDYDDFAARLSLNWEPDPDTLLFASYNRGIKGGNWTLSANVTAENFRHDPETLHSFELGGKYMTPDGGLRINGTLYHYIYEDYQAFAVVGGTPQVSNSDARASGAELEVMWSPARRLNLLLGGTWQTSKVEEVLAAGELAGPEFFPGAPDAQYCTNQGGFFLCDFPQDIVRDAKFPNAPKFSLNYLIRHDFDMAGGVAAVQVDGAWYDDQYLEVTNGQASLQPSYNVTNASLSWTDPSETFELTVWARNVFDKAYRAYTLNLGILGTTSYYAPPATYGATARISW